MESVTSLDSCDGSSSCYYSYAPLFFEDDAYHPCPFLFVCLASSDDPGHHNDFVPDCILRASLCLTFWSHYPACDLEE